MSEFKNTIRIISANLLTTTRLPLNDEGGMGDRAMLFKSIRDDLLPDSMGLCEVTQEWLDCLMGQCDDRYGLAGTKPCKGEKGTLRSGSGEYVPIVYRKDLYECTDEGGWWFSPTPDERSRFEIEGHPSMKYDRVFSYAIFKRRDGACGYAHINVHYDHKSDDYVNTLCSKLLSEKMYELKERYGDIPVIATGDFNCEEDAEAYKYLNTPGNGFLDAKYASKEYTDGPTFFGLGPEFADGTFKGKIIDFIFVSAGDAECIKSDIIEKPVCSDHYPIVSTMNI